MSDYYCLPPESRWDQEEGGELDSHEEVRLSFVGPGEIKRREVSWTLTKKLDFHLWVQARSRRGRWCWTLKRARKRSVAGRWSWAQKVGLLLLQFVPQQLCYGHCPRDCSTQQLKQQLHSTLVSVQWWGFHCLNIVVVLAVVHGLLSLLGQNAHSSHSLSPPPPPIPNIVIRFMVSVDVKHHINYLLFPQYDL